MIYRLPTVLVAPIVMISLFSVSALAQPNVKNGPRSWDDDRRSEVKSFEDEIFKAGAEVSSPEAKQLLEYYTEHFTAGLPEELKEGSLNRMIALGESAQRLYEDRWSKRKHTVGEPEVVKLHNFIVSRTAFGICPSKLNILPGFLAIVLQAALDKNKEFVSCAVEHMMADASQLELVCIAPLFYAKEKHRGGFLNLGWKKEFGQVNRPPRDIVTPNVDEIARKVADQYEKEETEKIRAQLESLKAQLAEERERLKREAMEKIAKLKEEFQKNLIFGMPEEKSVSFLVDGSGSLGAAVPGIPGMNFAHYAILQLKQVIPLLEPNQMFSLGIFRDCGRILFNSGKAVYATPENVAAAVAYLDQMESFSPSCAEDCGGAMEEVLQGNPEAYYLFTDGQFTSSDYVKVKAIQKQSGAKVYVKPMSSWNQDFLNSLVQVSGGEMFSEIYSIDFAKNDLKKMKREFIEARTVLEREAKRVMAEEEAKVNKTYHESEEESHQMIERKIKELHEKLRDLSKCE